MLLVQHSPTVASDQTSSDSLTFTIDQFVDQTLNCPVIADGRLGRERGGALVTLHCWSDACRAVQHSDHAKEAPPSTCERHCTLIRSLITVSSYNAAHIAGVAPRQISRKPDLSSATGLGSHKPLRRSVTAQQWGSTTARCWREPAAMTCRRQWCVVL